MPIFQKSVVQKHLKNIDNEVLDKAYEKFQQNFNAAKIAQIKQLKEEEYQDGFLRDIFVDVFGYVLKPEADYNLVREFKNQADGKKADGAILKNGDAIAVIELKSTKTKDLSKITQQAFNYKNNQPECKYVVTSNFQKLRFYIDYANEYEEFDLFHLSKEQFKVLYLILNKDSILSNLPLKLKEETLFHEQSISANLYKDYSAFKQKLFENLVQNNQEIDKLTLFKKSQKLIDRFLFILFAEDSGLLPPNSIARVINRFNILKEEDAYKPLYDIFKQYFGYMNIGRKGKNTPDDIPAYNGGLFYADQLLDQLVIDDEILIDDLLHLSEYDFNTEVDVNILGHIFEHSLSEIEEITAELEGTSADKTKSKRKKDGVFYTPKYITRYIVENTIGKLCNEKRKALDIEEIEFDGSHKTKGGKLSAKGKKLHQKLTDYKDWLLQLKIIDPACGSGAFLNQSLNFLIEEHTNIDDILTELTGELPFHQVDKSILENNLYGVDINEESVEIAKLSLWLRTAQKGRKLSNLNNNIKCGNSLIDDPDIAGDKAFNWQKEFPEIMQNGGFDVVIGNPPYVQIQGMGEMSNYLQKQDFDTFERTGDLYVLFYELGNKILKENGLLGFITSNKWMRANYGKTLRKYLAENTNPLILIDLGSGIFDSATVDSNILIFRKQKVKEHQLKAIDISKENKFISFDTYENKDVFITYLSEKIWTISNPIEQELKNKVEKIGTPIKDWDIEINRGILTGFNDAFIIDKEIKENLIKKDPKNKEIIKPVLRGRDVKRYLVDYQDLYLINTHNGYKNIPPVNINEYPAIKEYLDQFIEKLEKRYDKGITPYNLRNCAYIDDFEKNKIVWKEMSSETPFCYDDKGYFTNDTITFMVGKNLKYLLPILNSKLNLYIFSKYYSGGGLGNKGIRFKKEFIKNIPIKKITKERQQPFIEKADLMLKLNKQLQTKKKKFLKRITEHFGLKKISKKLNAFYNYDFKTFVSELKKQKIKLSLTQQDEWDDYFNAYKTEINQIQAQISKTDQQIDQMVYQLYELTPEEIAVVEENVK